jgi:hypothetical protein
MMLWFLLGCGTNENLDFNFGKTQSCSINTDCPRGMLCLQEQCVKTDCLTSSDCPYNKYCTELRKCKKGCEVDTDCKTGSLCNEDGTCEEYSCRNTVLDCQTGEYCQEDGCSPTDFPICEPCSYDDFVFGLNEGICAVVDWNYMENCTWDSSQQRPLSNCPNGLQCLPSEIVGLDSGGGVCAETQHLKRCSDDNPCPRGFYCYDNIFRSSDPENQVAACLGNCEFYIEEGYLP